MHVYTIHSAVLKKKKFALFKITVFDCGEDTGESHGPLLNYFLSVMD